MHANETLLELWIEALCAELGELSGAIITASIAPHENSQTTTYETALLAQGLVQGEIFVIVEAGALVQMTQLASGEPLDPEVASVADRIEAWRRLVDSTANRLSTKISADYTDASNSRCVILLADTRPVEEGNALSGEPGSRIQRWLLQAGQSTIAILARVKIESPEELIAVPQQPVAEPQTLPPAGPDAQPSASLNDRFADPQHAAAQDVRQDPAKTEPAPRRRSSRDLNESNEPSALPHRLDLLLDIELEATLRFGSIEMPLREVLELGPGDVLSLDRHVQEPVELVVGDRIVARGEVVLIGGNFGLHVTEVAEPRRRLETIRCLF
jgi:flagellar motor switch protein FliN/FliY